MFKNTPHGFTMEFPNGWIISVQWGPGNYCEIPRDNPTEINHLTEIGHAWDGQHHDYESRTAEIAVMHKNHKRFYPLSKHDDVRGWQTVEEVNEWMQWVSKLDRDYNKVMSQAHFAGLEYHNDYHDNTIATFKML